MQIREISLQELDSAFELVRHLRTNLDYDTFEDRVYAMRHQEYTMTGIFEQGELVCFAGYSVLVNLAHGRHLFLFDLITHPQMRSRGYGKEMLLYLRDQGKIKQCERIVLSSGWQRKDAHRFYEKEGFESTGALFVAPL